MAWQQVFHDDFVGTNGDPLDPNKWSTWIKADFGFCETIEIDNNTALMHAGQFRLHRVGVRANTQTFEFPLRIRGDFELETLNLDRGYRHRLFYSVSNETNSGGLDSDGVENGYRLEFRNSDEGSRIRISRVDNESTTTIGADTSTHINNDTRYEYELEITQDGSDWVHKVWVWEATGSKPGSPQLSLTDNNHLAGWVIVQSMNRFDGDDDLCDEGIQTRIDEFEVYEEGAAPVTADISDLSSSDGVVSGSVSVSASVNDTATSVDDASVLVQVSGSVQEAATTFASAQVAVWVDGTAAGQTVSTETVSGLTQISGAVANTAETNDAPSGGVFQFGSVADSAQSTSETEGYGAISAVVADVASSISVIGGAEFDAIFGSVLSTASSTDTVAKPRVIWPRMPILSSLNVEQEITAVITVEQDVFGWINEER